MGMQLIETITLASSASSIEFTSIPQDGVDLVLLVSGRVDADGANQVAIRLNGDTTVGNYSRIGLFGGAGAASSGGPYTNGLVVQVSQNDFTANTFSSNSIIIANYTASQNKSISVDGVNENNGVSANQRLWALTWADTSAVTSLTVDGVGNNLVQYSTASLYKITAD